MDNSDIIDSDLMFESNSDKIDVELINTSKFIILCLASFGLYVMWWMYKSWKFLKEKDGLEIIPAARAIFGVLFSYALFERILEYAKLNGYDRSYSSGALFVGFLVLNLLSRLPDPYWVISIFSFICLIEPFRALNYAIENSESYNGIYRSNFNTRQIILIIVGSIFTALLIIGLILPE